MLSMWFCIRSVSALSRMLNQVFVSEMGLCCCGSFGRLGSFGSSTMVASPMSSGTYLVVQMLCMILYVISSVTSPPAYMASALILSGPAALSLASFLMMFFISSLLGGLVGGLVDCWSSGVPYASYISCQYSWKPLCSS